jgi:DNA topoisomerase IA
MKIKKSERILLDPGYRQAYTPPEKEKPISKTSSHLSNLRRGQRIQPRRVQVRPRAPGLSEAQLLRILQEQGIGRPSTYAGITAELLRRKYVRKDGGRLVLTPRGDAVQSYLSSAHPHLFDLAFSARLEKRLDRLAAGKLGYKALISEVWELVEKA